LREGLGEIGAAAWASRVTPEAAYRKRNAALSAQWRNPRPQM
jgi:hypothetical protein